MLRRGTAHPERARYPRGQRPSEQRQRQQGCQGQGNGRGPCAGTGGALHRVHWRPRGFTSTRSNSALMRPPYHRHSAPSWCFHHGMLAVRACWPASTLRVKTRECGAPRRPAYGLPHMAARARGRHAVDRQFIRFTPCPRADLVAARTRLRANPCMPCRRPVCRGRGRPAAHGQRHWMHGTTASHRPCPTGAPNVHDH